MLWILFWKYKWLRKIILWFPYFKTSGFLIPRGQKNIMLMCCFLKYIKTPHYSLRSPVFFIILYICLLSMNVKYIYIIFLDFDILFLDTTFFFFIHKQCFSLIFSPMAEKTACLFYFLLFIYFFILTWECFMSLFFRGRGRERKRENISVREEHQLHAFPCTLTGNPPITWVCALSKDQTHILVVHRTML